MAPTLTRRALEGVLLVAVSSSGWEACPVVRQLVRPLARVPTPRTWPSEAPCSGGGLVSRAAAFRSVAAERPTAGEGTSAAAARLPLPAVA